MTSLEDLILRIKSGRMVSKDKSLVIYDLTRGIDFSKPELVAEALSDVFFKMDAVNWFKIIDENIDFNPNYKVRVVLADVHQDLIQNTSDDFLLDLEKDDIGKKLSSIIRKEDDNDLKLDKIVAAGTLKSTIFRHGEEKVLKNYIKDDLFTDILEVLEIKSLNNDDLINWQRLHL